VSLNIKVYSTSLIMEMHIEISFPGENGITELCCFPLYLAISLLTLALLRSTSTNGTYVDKSIHCSAMCHSKSLEITQMSISRELLAMVHPHNGIQCNHGKE
jgi:hypothetical protein